MKKNMKLKMYNVSYHKKMGNGKTAKKIAKRVTMSGYNLDDVKKRFYKKYSKDNVIDYIKRVVNKSR